MGKRLGIVIIMAVAAVRVNALDVAAGRLSEALSGTDAAQTTALALRGTLDARDFKYISDCMPALAELDLSEAAIAEYSDREALFGNYTYYPADELPKMGLAGSALRLLTLPAGLKAIGEGALAGCLSLRTITVPAGVTAIGDCAFSGCSALTEVAGGEGVRAVGDYAFSRCAALAAVSGLSAVERIGSHAFLECGSLASFAFPSALSAIGECAFQGSGLTAADMSGCASLTVGAWAFADNAALTTLALPAATVSVGDGAFFYDSALQTVALPSGLARINDFTFMGGRLVGSVTLPDNLTEIGDYAFADWESMASVVVPGRVTRIGERAFRNWTCLQRLTARPSSPPELGADVWEGVAKSGVSLDVPEGSEPLYRSADQWKDFLIPSGTVEELAGRRMAVVSENDRIAVSSSDDMDSASLYDLTGVLLSEKAVGGRQVVFDLSRYSGRVYVVRCVFADGTAELLKIGRK